jgi:FdhE protein
MNRNELKTAALRRIAESSPEYAEIMPLFITLYEHLQGRDHDTGISIAPGIVSLPERIQEGFPVLSPADLRVERQQAVAFLAEVTKILSRKGQESEDYLPRIDAALAAGVIDPAVIFSSILERRRTPIVDASVALGVPAALVEFVFEIPLKVTLELFAAGYQPDDFPGWHEGYCPVCGSRAAMAELSGEEGHRFLCCSTCAFRWPFLRLKCPYCGNEETDKLSYFTVGEGPYRVDTCNACSRYIKTRDSRKGHDDVPMEIEEMATIHLDLLAVREGFERGK